MTIGQSIKRARMERGISQSELSKMCGVSQPEISNWEADKVAPGVFSLISVADSLDISIDELVGRKRK